MAETRLSPFEKIISLAEDHPELFEHGLRKGESAGSAYEFEGTCVVEPVNAIATAIRHRNAPSVVPGVDIDLWRTNPSSDESLAILAGVLVGALNGISHLGEEAHV